MTKKNHANKHGMQTLAVPCPTAARLPPFSSRFPARSTRNPVHFHAKPLCISARNRGIFRANPRSSPSEPMPFSRFRALIRTSTPREHTLAQVAIRQRSQHFPLTRETRGIISQCNYRQRPYQHTKKGRASPLLCITSYSFSRCAASWGSSSKPS